MPPGVPTPPVAAKSGLAVALWAQMSPYTRRKWRLLLKKPGVFAKVYVRNIRQEYSSLPDPPHYVPPPKLTLEAVLRATRLGWAEYVTDHKAEFFPNSPEAKARRQDAEEAREREAAARAAVRAEVGDDDSFLNTDMSAEERAKHIADMGAWCGHAHARKVGVRVGRCILSVWRCDVTVAWWCCLLHCAICSRCTASRVCYSADSSSDARRSSGCGPTSTVVGS